MTAAWALLLLGACAADPGELAAQSQALLAKDDTAGAEIQARQWVSQVPGSPQARAMLARVLLARQSLKDAAEESSRALRLGLPADEYAPLQAEILLAQGRLDGLLGLLDEHRPAQPAALAALRIFRARAFLAQERLQEARAEVTQAVELAPALLPAREMSIRMQASEGSATEALRLAQALVQEHPTSGTGWALLGDLLLDQPEGPARAAQAYAQALTLRPRLLNAHAGLVQIHQRTNNREALRAQLAAMDNALPNHPTTHFLQAQFAFAEGKWPLARTRLQPLVYRAGVPAEVLYLAGLVELQAGNPVAASDFLSRSITRRPAASPPRLALAGLHIQAGRLEDALAQLKVVQAAEPNNHLAWALQGEALVRARAFSKADQAFARALKLQPKDQAVRMAVARGLVSRGDRKAALALLGEMARLEGASIEVGMQWARLLAETGAADGAMQALEVVARQHPQSPAPALARAQRLLQQDQLVQAREALAHALTLDPANLEATASLATLNTADGDVPAAMKAYRDLLIRNPRAAEAMLRLATLTPLSGGTRARSLEWIDMAVAVSPADPSLWSQVVETQLHMGDLTGALARAQAATQAVPGHAGLHLQLARLKLLAGEPAQAAHAMGRAAQLEPQSATPLVAQALAELATGRSDQARQLLARANTLSPHNDEVLRAELKLATTTTTTTTTKSQDRAPALALLRREQQQRPQRALGWQLQGEWESQQQRHAEAAAAFEVALAKEPLPVLARQLHASLRAAGQPERAASFEAKWQSQQPQDASFAAYAAEQAMRDEQPERAVGLLERAARLQPADPTVMNNLAAARLAAKHPDALPTAWRAVALSPASPDALDTLALAQAAAGQTDKAMASLQAILQIQPRDAAARMRLAELLIKAQSLDAAKKELRLLTHEGTPDAQRRAAQRALESLGS